MNAAPAGCPGMPPNPGDAPPNPGGMPPKLGMAPKPGRPTFTGAADVLLADSGLVLYDDAMEELSAK